MLKLITKVSFALFLSTIIYSQKSIKLKKGKWNAHLYIKESVLLPVRFEINQNNKNIEYIIYNATEKIILNKIDNKSSDSIKLEFPNYYSYLLLKIESSKNLAGYWYNLNKKNNYKIPFYASFNTIENTCKNQDTIPLTGKWKTLFEPNSKSEEKAVGLFSMKNSNEIYGTFLTESGDFRFLEGKNCQSSFYLSCFDGSHAFLFTGKFENNEIKGKFYSGIHYEADWIASKDANFNIRNPDSITYISKQEKVHFELNDIQGKSYTFPNDSTIGKVNIIQIMGTWCPNCLDETKFFKEMYDKYKSKGLQIISIAYESPDKFEDQVFMVKRLKLKYNLDFTFLIGGQANKNLASLHFPMLNSVTSYPTSIIINKKGDVVKIHTGFNGPGTGDIYKNFRDEFEKFIIKELNL